ncbi:MAG: hypothetical protein FJ388_22915, partial [Verrucomicrobia bacterium]|nr:hypothetical protein [Verrucomicrobiota bacterium]
MRLIQNHDNDIAKNIERHAKEGRFASAPIITAAVSNRRSLEIIILLGNFRRVVAATMNVRILRLFLALAMLCAGCGRQTSPPPPATTAEQPLAGKSIADLIAALGSEDTTARVAAADELRRRGPAATEAIRPLLKAMTGKSMWGDLAMMDAIAAMGEPALPILAKIFEDPKDELRTAAGRAIWKFGAAAKSVVPVVQKVAEDKTDTKQRELAQ